MAEAFNLAGVPSVVVYSGSDEGREEALEKLRSGKIKVLFRWICSMRAWISKRWIWSYF